MMLDWEKAREVLEPAVKFRWEWLVENGLLDRLEGCVAPDPRLAAIAALPVQEDSPGTAWLNANKVHAILAVVRPTEGTER